MAIEIDPIEDGEAGLSVRTKLNQLIAGAKAGKLGEVTHEDLALIIDTQAPAVPRGLTMTSVVDPAPVMTLTWDFNNEADFLYYDLQIKEGGNWLGFQTSSETFSLSVRPKTTYTARIRAVDRSGNASLFSAIVTHTTAADDIPPAMPIGVTAKAGLESIWLKWTPNTESDLARYELYESAVGATPTDNTAPSHSTAAANFVRAGLDMAVERFFWIRAVDTSGNASPWSAGVSATTGSIRGEIKVMLVGVTFLPGAGTSGNQLAWSGGSINYGPAGEPPIVQAIPGGSVEWSSGTVYVRYIPGDTAISTTTSLTDVYVNDALVLGIYRGGADFQLIEGKAFMDGGLILAQTVGANQLVANAAVITGTAQIAEAIIEDAHITELDAAKLIAGTIMSGEILVDGDYQLNNPAAGVNLGTTKIKPGSVLISGGTSLSNWIKGGDETHIDGGMLSTGTVTAEKAVFGQRGITVEGLEFEANKPTTNKVAWSAGSIKYTGDDGNTAAFNVSSGSATWSADTLYIYYVKGSTSLAASASVPAAFQSDRVVLATYRGGADLVNDYGRTVIDGSKIKTGTITALQADIASFRTSILIAGAVTADVMAVGALSAISANAGTLTAGVIKSADGKVVIDLDNGFIEMTT